MSVSTLLDVTPTAWKDLNVRSITALTFDVKTLSVQDADVKGTLTVHGATSLLGATTAASIAASGAVSAASLSASGAVSGASAAIGAGGLSVGAAILATGPVGGSELHALGPATVGTDLTVTGQVNVGGSLKVNGKISTTGLLVTTHSSFVDQWSNADLTPSAGGTFFALPEQLTRCIVSYGAAAVIGVTFQLPTVADLVAYLMTLGYPNPAATANASSYFTIYNYSSDRVFPDAGGDPAWTLAPTAPLVNFVEMLTSRTFRYQITAGGTAATLYF